MATMTAAEVRKQRARDRGGLLEADDNRADLLESEDRLRRQNEHDPLWVARQPLPEELAAVAEAEALYAKAIEDLDAAKWNASTLVETAGQGFLDRSSGAGFVDATDEHYREAQLTAEVALLHLNRVRQWSSARADERLAAVTASLNPNARPEAEDDVV